MLYQNCLDESRNEADWQWPIWAYLLLQLDGSRSRNGRTWQNWLTSDWSIPSSIFIWFWLLRMCLSMWSSWPQQCLHWTVPDQILTNWLTGTVCCREVDWTSILYLIYILIFLITVQSKCMSSNLGLLIQPGPLHFPFWNSEALNQSLKLTWSFEYFIILADMYYQLSTEYIVTSATMILGASILRSSPPSLFIENLGLGSCVLKLSFVCRAQPVNYSLLSF